MTTTVQLGSVKLEAFEVPASIAFGGKQKLAVHELPGGGRVIDVLGGADADIGFAGIISGSGAESRAQLLNALRVAGTPLPLSWGEQYYLVIISDAEFDYRKPWWIPYRLRCVVQSNLASSAAATSASAAVSVAASIASAASVLGSGSGVLTAAQTALAQPDASTYGTSAYGSSVSALSAALSLTSNDIADTGAALPSLDLGFTGKDPVAAASTIMSITDDAGTLATLTAAGGYIGSGLSLLQNIGT